MQNGNAEFSLELVASFEPSCSPSTTVVWSNVTVSDTEHAGRGHVRR